MANNLNTSEFPNLITKFPRLEVWDSVVRSNQQRLNFMFHRFGVTEGLSFPTRQAREIMDSTTEALNALKMTPPFQFDIRLKGKDTRGLPLVPIADKHAGFLLHEHPGFVYNAMSATNRDVYVFNTRNCDGQYVIGNSGLGFSNTDDAVTKFMSISTSSQVTDKIPAILMSKKKNSNQDANQTGESLPLSNALSSLGREFLIIGIDKAVLHVFKEIRNPDNPLSDVIISHRCATINLDNFSKQPIDWISSTNFSDTFAEHFATPQGQVKNPLFSGPTTLPDIKKVVSSLFELGWVKDSTKVVLNYGW